MERTSLTERVISLLLARLEQESDPEKASRWIELLERVAAGQIKRYDEEKQQVASRQSPVADKGR
jgi:hypothetical protein